MAGKTGPPALMRDKPVTVGGSIFLVALIAFVLLLLPLDGSHVAGEPSFSLKSAKLSFIPEGYVAREIVFSPDGSSAAFGAIKDGKWRVFAGGVEGRAYDYVQMIAISPDGRRVAYSARKGDREVLVVDAREGRPYEVACNPRFSPDGGSVAYEAREGGKWRIVFGEHESASADMSFMPPVFSPDGGSVAYILLDYEKGASTVFVSDVGTGELRSAETYDRIGGFRFNPGSPAFAYEAARQGREFVVLGGFARAAREGKSYESVRGLVLSADGSTVAYLARKRDKWFIVKGDEEGPEGYDAVRSLSISPGGLKVAAVLSVGGKSVVVVEDRAGRPYDAVSEPVFSPDGSLVAYTASRGGKWFLVVGDEEGPAYDMAVSPVFSPDGRRIVYRARRDGRRFIVIAGRDAAVVREGPEHDFLWQPVFGPDGRHVAYGAVSGNEIWWKVEAVE